jgi:hypothetical protein
MRNPVVVLILAVTMPFTVSAQHGTGSTVSGAASAGATPVAHSAPAPATVVSRSTPSQVGNQAHVANPGNHASANNVKPVPPHRRHSNPGSQPPINSGTGYPVASHNCNRHYGYPIQGLSACSAPQIPYYGATYYLPVPYYVDTSATNQEQVQEDDQDQATNDEQQNADSDNGDQVSPQPSGSTGEDHSSTDSLSEFVFIQRDGSKFYAVAYSFMKDKLQYVTVDGVRHTLGVDALDFDATQKINEQLGNTINLPSLPLSGIALNIQPTPLRQPL